MNPPKKLTQKTEEQQQTVAGQQEQQATAGAKEFASVEDMLRHDALHTPVPPSIGRRLEQSLRDLPPPSTPWWRRWLGGAR